MEPPPRPTNRAPVVTIYDPPDGDSVWNQLPSPSTRALSGSASDPETGRLFGSSLRWTSSRQGTLGEGEELDVVLSDGAHLIVLSAIDSAGARGTDTVRVWAVDNHLPEILSMEWSAPALLDTVSVRFTAEIRDADEEIPDEWVRWRGSFDGPLGEGRSIEALLSPGEQEIHVEVRDRTNFWVSDHLSLEVDRAVPFVTPRVDRVEPDTLRPGGEVRLIGQGLERMDVELMNLFQDEIVRTDTLLVLEFIDPYCFPPGLLEFTLSYDEEDGNRVWEPLRHPYAPETYFDGPPVGERVFLGPDEHCLVVPAGSPAEEYLVGVQLVAEDPSVTALASLLQVNGAGRDGNGVIAPSRRETPDLRPPVERPDEPVEIRLRRWEREHLDPREAMGRRPSDVALEPASVVPVEGDRMEIRVPSVVGSDPCREFRTIRAEVTAVGDRVALLEDLEDGWSRFDDDQRAEIVRVVEERGWPTLTGYFGTPSDMDLNERILLVMTPEVNHGDGLLGFVFAGDFFDRTECPSSDGGEVTYLRVPDAVWTPERALPEYVPLVVHEITHVIQIGRRIQVPDVVSFPTAWEAEGQATLSEELVGREILGFCQDAELGADEAFAVDERGAEWLSTAFLDLARYFGLDFDGTRIEGAPHECTWLGVEGPCVGGRNVYGTSWSFLRWITDKYGPSHVGGAAGLHRELVEHPESGFVTLEEVVRVPMVDLLSGWAASLALDGGDAAVDPEFLLPSWDLPRVMERFPRAGRLSVQWPGGGDLPVRAGSTAYFRVGGGDTAYSVTLGQILLDEPVPQAIDERFRVWMIRTR